MAHTYLMCLPTFKIKEPDSCAHFYFKKARHCERNKSSFKIPWEQLSMRSWLCSGSGARESSGLTFPSIDDGVTTFKMSTVKRKAQETNYESLFSVYNMKITGGAVRVKVVLGLFNASNTLRHICYIPLHLHSQIISQKYNTDCLLVL